MTELPLTGRCLCGEVRYEITAEPTQAGYCHCTRCQRRSGTAASANLSLAPGSLRITAGESLIDYFAPPDGWAKAFCSACGSALFSRDPDDHELAGLIGVRMGTLDSDPGIAPSYRQYVADAAPWEPLPDDDLTLHPEHRRS